MPVTLIDVRNYYRKTLKDYYSKNEIDFIDFLKLDCEGCEHELMLHIFKHNLEKKIFEINDKLKKNLPTIPSTIGEELSCNIFLRAKNLEDFSKLRDLKDNF